MDQELDDSKTSTLSLIYHPPSANASPIPDDAAAHEDDSRSALSSINQNQ